SISGSLTGQDGIIINSGYTRYQGRIVLDQTISDKIKAGINVNYTHAKKYGTISNTTESGPTSSLMYSVWGFRPVTGDSLNDVNIIDEPFDPDVDPMNEYRINPVLSNKNEYKPIFNNTLISNAYIE